MSNFLLLPSILAADHGQFIAEMATVDLPAVEYLHVDVMDGHFVPNITFGPKVVASLKAHTRFKLDCHLMIEKVDDYIPAFAAAGADIITIHAEATHHLQRSLALIREKGAKAGVAINPATSLESIRWVLEDIDLVLIMSVNPGFGGQAFIPAALEKIRVLAEQRRKENRHFIIEVDGGIDARTAPQAYASGAEFLVAGSAIFGKKDRRAAIAKLHQAVETEKQKLHSLYT